MLHSSTEQSQLTTKKKARVPQKSRGDSVTNTQHGNRKPQTKKKNIDL